MGRKGDYLPSLAETASIWQMDAEEGRLLEVNGDDLRALMKGAGWANPKSIPVSIDIVETINAGGLVRLLRGEDHHRRMREKYRRAARYPWLPVDPDPPSPRLPTITNPKPPSG